MDNIVIREVSLIDFEEDVEGIINLLNVLKENKSDAEFRKMRCDMVQKEIEAMLLVAVDLSRGDLYKNVCIVGTAQLIPVIHTTAFEYEIHDVVRDPDERYSGVGRKMLECILDELRLRAKDQGRAISVTLTSKPDRKAANKLYLSLGFTLTSMAVRVEHNKFLEGTTNRFQLILE